MANTNKNQADGEELQSNTDEVNNEQSVNEPGRDMDLPDSPDDEKHMQSEEVILDLPDVEDIPGQEHVHIPSLGELADTTISSDDEEGVGIFEEDDEEDTEVIMGTDADVTPTEENDLKTSAEDMPTQDEEILREAALDNADEEGELLNEGSSNADVSGEDLDTPGAEEDDPDEAIGEEDEENNSYSLGGDEKDH